MQWIFNNPSSVLRTLCATNLLFAMPSQDYTADDSSNRCFECSKMQLFEPLCESLHCLGEEWSVFGGWFSCCFGRQLANKWLCSTQKWLFCVVLEVQLRHEQFFRKKQEIICLEALRAFVRKQLLLDLPHLETPIQSTAIYFRLHTLKSMIHQLSWCHRCVLKHRDCIFGAFLWARAFFFRAINKLCGTQRKQIFLPVKCSCNIEWRLVPH